MHEDVATVVSEEAAAPKSVTNCGCPLTCNATALAYKAPGLPFTCGARIKYLMSKHGDLESTACSLAVQRGACGSGCDTRHCDRS